jgi:hypothetical protein
MTLSSSPAILWSVCVLFLIAGRLGLGTGELAWPQSSRCKIGVRFNIRARQRSLRLAGVRSHRACAPRRGVVLSLPHVSRACAFGWRRARTAPHSSLSRSLPLLHATARTCLPPLEARPALPLFHPLADALGVPARPAVDLATGPK